MALSRTTYYWRPNEHSLSRESFNDIVNRRQTDVSAVLMRTSSMSRLAMLGKHGLETRILGSTSRKHGSSQRSVQFDSRENDGSGSIRLGTPVFESPRNKRPHFLSDSKLASGSLEPRRMMEIKATPAARFGYMPPGAGRISRRSSDVSTGSRLSNELKDKIVRLFQSMDFNGDGSINRSDAAHHFKRFPEVSADAMFSEVDEDHNDEISLQEFVDFWDQVKKSGYTEEDLNFEIDQLIQGDVWVDYADDRIVGHSDHHPHATPHQPHHDQFSHVCNWP